MRGRWTALDPDTELKCSWLVGERSPDDAEAFMADLAGRLSNRVQITTDGFPPCVKAIAAAFRSNVDCAMLKTEYGSDPSEDGRFGPPVVLSETVRFIEGSPDESKISTSFVERPTSSHASVSVCQCRQKGRQPATAYFKRTDAAIAAAPAPSIGESAGRLTARM
jgi:hypothetical protein